MATSHLTNFQLYALMQNKRLHSSIRAKVKSELEGRSLSPEDWGLLRKQYEAHYPSDDGPGLSITEKLLLILVPAVFTIQILWAARNLASHKRRQWKDFWFYVSVGYFLWTVAALLFVRWLRNGIY